MKALVYHESGKPGREEKPKPAIKNSRDAIIRITKTNIFEFDIHIINRDVPEMI